MGKYCKMMETYWPVQSFKKSIEVCSNLFKFVKVCPSLSETVERRRSGRKVDTFRHFQSAEFIWTLLD